MAAPENPRPELVPFGELYCRRYRCGETRFRRGVFWGCIYRRGIPAAVLSLLFYPAALFEAEVLIKDLWRARTMREIQEAMDYYHGVRHGSGLFRTVRISSGRVRRMAGRIFAEFGQI
jgi:hypothetical protein